MFVSTVGQCLTQAAEDSLSSSVKERGKLFSLFLPLFLPQISLYSVSKSAVSKSRLCLLLLARALSQGWLDTDCKEIRRRGRVFDDFKLIIEIDPTVTPLSQTA